MVREILRFVEKDIHSRELILLSIPKLPDIFPLPTRKNSYFQLFLAIDGHEKVAGDLDGIPEKLIHEGLAYLSAWGPDCSRIHDIFDLAIAQIEIESGIEKAIMTTWHSEETLEEALWFFLFAAFPDDAFVNSCETSYLVSVANQEWTSQIANALSNIDALSHRVVGD